MPFIKSLVSECCTYIVTLILSLGVIMPIYSYCTEKKLVCVIIAAPFSHQPSFCSECTRLNIYSFYNIKLVFNTKCTFLMHFYSL